MDNKKLGAILICVSLILLVLLGFMRASIIKAYQADIDSYIEAGEACPADPDICPHEQRARAQIPIFIAGALLIGVISLGAYLIFFEKSQREIVSALRKEKRIQSAEEKFSILLKGLDADEKKVVRAVKEQNGITQQTLRLRTDLHKSKLSIVLDGLEKKGLVKRVSKGKTKQVFLKIAV
jgi:DNA-binding MarR family transcriptional regulator